MVVLERLNLVRLIAGIFDNGKHNGDGLVEIPKIFAMHGGFFDGAP